MAGLNSSKETGRKQPTQLILFPSNVKINAPFSLAFFPLKIITRTLVCADCVLFMIALNAAFV